jgi:RimJ/RimL family protein N-acetyltransferase
LVLREWRDDDVEPMTAINADPEVAQWLGPIDPSKTSERISTWVEHWARHGFGLWAVEEKAGGRMIGRVGLVKHDDWIASPHDAEVGWTLARDAWGHGYATEGARAALAFARDVGLRRIISITLPHNIRSRRVMERLGLEYGGAAQWRGFDQVWYAIELAADG